MALHVHAFVRYVDAYPTPPTLPATDASHAQYLREVMAHFNLHGHSSAAYGDLFASGPCATPKEAKAKVRAAGHLCGYTVWENGGSFYNERHFKLKPAE